MLEKNYITNENMFPTGKFNPGNPEVEKIENQSSARARERGGTGDLMVVTGEREG